MAVVAPNLGEDLTNLAIVGLNRLNVFADKLRVSGNFLLAQLSGGFLILLVRGL